MVESARRKERAADALTKVILGNRLATQREVERISPRLLLAMRAAPARLTLLADQPAGDQRLPAVRYDAPSGPFIVMEYLTGGTLAVRILEGMTSLAALRRKLQPRRVNLGGRFVTPGLCDAHGHVAGLGFALERLAAGLSG